MYLVQMAGSPGSGKSTLATILGERLPAVVLDKDVIKSSLLRSGVPEQVAAPTAYEIFFALAEDLLARGHSVVLDSPSYWPSIPERGVAVARKHGARYVFVECTCPLDVVERRIASRTPMPSQGGRATDRPSVRPDTGLVVVVDTGGHPDAAATTVLAALATRAG